VRGEIAKLAERAGSIAFVGTEVPPRPGFEFTAPVALAKVAAHHGLSVSVPAIALACGADEEEGTNLFRLEQTARHLGFATRGSRFVEGADPRAVLAKCPLPFIVLFSLDDEGGLEYGGIFSAEEGVAVAERVKYVLLLAPRGPLRALPAGLRVRASYVVERVLHAAGECEPSADENGFRLEVWDEPERPAVRVGEGARRLLVAEWVPDDDGRNHRLRASVALPLGDPLEAAFKEA